MTVHMLRVQTSQPQVLSVAQIRQAVENWTARYDESLPEQRQTITLVEPVAAIDETAREPFLSGEWRFAWDEDADVLVQTIIDTLSEVVDWGIVRYHECNHDETSPAGCQWDRVETVGEPPASILES